MAKKELSRLVKWLIRTPIAVGIILLAIGFTPQILAEINIDTTPPNIVSIIPDGTGANPSPLQLNEVQRLELVSDSSDVNVLSGKCEILYVEGGSPASDIVTLNWEGTASGITTFGYDSYVITVSDVMYEFKFQVEDFGGRTAYRSGFGEVGEAAGDFWIKDSNDLEYEIASETSVHYFDSQLVNFEFRATNAAYAITSVWVEVWTTDEVFLLAKQTGGETWNGYEWDATRDGTFIVKGFFTAWDTKYTAMTLVGAINGDVNIPKDWTIYTYSQAFGVGFIAFGIALQGWKRFR